MLYFLNQISYLQKNILLCWQPGKKIGTNIKICANLPWCPQRTHILITASKSVLWHVFHIPDPRVIGIKRNNSPYYVTIQFPCLLFSRKTTKMSSPFSLQFDIFETASCLSRWFQLTFLCIFWHEKSGDVHSDIFYNSMRNFLHSLLFTDSQILPCRTDFCAVYLSVNNWNRRLT